MGSCSCIALSFYVTFVLTRNALDQVATTAKWITNYLSNYKMPWGVGSHTTG